MNTRALFVVAKQPAAGQTNCTAAADGGKKKGKKGKKA